MIVRVLTARVDRSNVAEANALMRPLLDEIRVQPGIAYAKLARRLLEDDGEQLILMEEWLTPADLFHWTGGRLQRARLPERVDQLLEGLVITHYESLDRLPTELELEELPGGAPEADVTAYP